MGLQVTLLYANLQGEELRWWAERERPEQFFLLSGSWDTSKFRWWKWFIWNTAADLGRFCKVLASPLPSDLLDTISFRIIQENFALFPREFTISFWVHLAYGNFQLFWDCFNSLEYWCCFNQRMVSYYFATTQPTQHLILFPSATESIILSSL